MHSVPTDAFKNVMHKNVPVSACYSNIKHKGLHSVSKVPVDVSLCDKLLTDISPNLGNPSHFVYFYMKLNFWGKTQFRNKLFLDSAGFCITELKWLNACFFLFLLQLGALLIWILCKRIWVNSFFFLPRRPPSKPQNTAQRARKTDSWDKNILTFTKLT